MKKIIFIITMIVILSRVSFSDNFLSESYYSMHFGGEFGLTTYAEVHFWSLVHNAINDVDVTLRGIQAGYSEPNSLVKPWVDKPEIMWIGSFALLYLSYEFQNWFYHLVKNAYITQGYDTNNFIFDIIANAPIMMFNIFDANAINSCWVPKGFRTSWRVTFTFTF